MKSAPRPASFFQICLWQAAAVCLVAVGGFAPSVAAQAVIRVNASAAAGGDGATWATAYQNLHVGLEAAQTRAQSTGAPVEVWVAAGTYKPDIGPGIVPGTRTTPFSVAANVSVYGGFIGNETTLLARNHRANPTILSGDLVGDDLPEFANRADNAHTIIVASGAGSAIDGVIIRGSSGGTAALGGAMLRRCTLIDNFNPGGNGGGASGFARVINCLFVGNLATNGGGLVTGDGQEVVGCVFSGNTAKTFGCCGDYARGGGIYVQAFGGTTLISNCTVAFNNSTTSGGAGAFGVGGGVGILGFGAVRFLNHIGHGNTAGIASGADVYGERAFGANLFTFEDYCRLSYFRVGNGEHSREHPVALDAQPFVNPPGQDAILGTADDNYRLTLISGAVDTGSNYIPYVGVPEDLAGNQRVVDGNADTFPRVDLGAYEFGAPPFTGRLYVRPGQRPFPDGLTWANAHSDLNIALAQAAVPDSQIREVWVAAGTYTPSPPISQGGSRSASFQLQNNLAIYGGFAGTETALGQRNVAANSTVLSGDLNGDDLGGLNRGENAYHVVTGSGSNATAVLDGFMIRAGFANGSGSPNTEGAGVHILGAGSPRIRNCSITGNSSSTNGSGVLVRSDAGTSYPVFENCLFNANVSTLPSASGAAVYHFGSGTTTFIACDFADNAAGSGGGAVALNAGGATFVRCRFIRNHAAGLGGALDIQAASAVSLVQCQFLGNSAGIPGAEGSGAGAIHCTGSSTATLFGGLFVGNTAPTSAAVGCSGSAEVTLTNCMVVANVTASSNYGALAGPTGTIRLRNSIVWANTRDDANIEAAQIGAPQAGTYDIGHSIVQGWSGTLGGAANNGLDPRFRRGPSPGADNNWGTEDDDYGDLRLTNGSPAIDSGDSGAVPADAFDVDADRNTTESVPLDLDEAARFFDVTAVANTGTGNPPVDRGPYEFVPPDTTIPGERRWVAPGGGAYASNDNWFPGVPGALDRPVFEIAGPFTVNFAAATPVANERAIVRRGHPVLDLNGSTYSLSSALSPALIVGEALTGPTSLTVTDGLLQPFSTIIGAGAGTHGTVNVTGATGRLSITQGALNVGFFGEGHLNITGGARVVSRNASVGDQPGSQGSSVTISGAGSRWTVPLLLTINNGSVHVTDGATLSNTFGILIFQGGSLSGNGTVVGPVINFGEVSPGNSPGTLTINGSYTQVGEIAELGSGSGQLTMQVEGLAPGQFDRLVITGETQLGGGLIVEAPPAGFPEPPLAGLSLPLIDALGGIGISDTTGTLADRFDVAFFPRVPGAGGGPSDKFLKLERPEGAGAQFFNLTTGTLGAPLNVNDPSNTTATSTPSSVTAGDLDGDGLADLVLTTPSNNSAVILMNRGTTGGEWQGFEGAVQFAVGSNPQAAAIFDIDQDGKPDISVANTGSNSVTLFRNTTITNSHVIALSGQGTLSTGTSPTGIDINHFDGSGTRPVIITADEVEGGISILVRTGTPGFNFTPRTSKPIPVATPPRQPRDLDIDGEGTRPDLALLSVGGSSVLILQNISMGTGIVAFADPTTLPVDSEPSELQVAMLRDGRASLITSNTAGNTMSVLVNTADLNNPTRFAPAVNIPAGTSPLSLTPIDIDSDTDADVAILTDTGTGANPLKVRLLRNDFIVNGIQQNDQVTFVNDRDLPDEGAPTNALFVIAAPLANPGVTDLLTINSQGGGRGPGQQALNVRPRLNLTEGGVVNPCFIDFNNDGFVEPGDLDEFITSYFSDFEEERNRCDFNNDGFVEPGDLDEYITSYFEGC